jgi:deferrochelatase/peroxidase EfeB
MRGHPSAGALVSRRSLLTVSAAVAGLGSAGVAATAIGESRRNGVHQPGITDRPSPYLAIAGIDLQSRRHEDLVRVLRAWTGVAAALQGRGNGAAVVTFGIGAALFESPGLGLDGRRPTALRPLPEFAGDAIDHAASDGDLCVMVTGAGADAVHHGVRALQNATRPLTRLRWKQTGFRPQGAEADPRGLLGFRDGTANLETGDAAVAERELWVDDGPQWLHGGTYLVVRRIRLLLDTWDQVSVPAQEAMVGRRRESNRRIDGSMTSHTALASPRRNDGATLLRRPYSYDAGVDGNGLQDSGLVFLGFQRDPWRQFVPIQRRLSESDELNAFSQHVSSALFACPPAVTPGGFIAEELVS